MEINLEEVQKEYIKYTEKYNLEDENVKRKQLHSLRVMENAKQIATNLKLSEEQTQIATLIGLLHDTGRFKQYTEIGLGDNIEGFDHGDYGAKVLFEDLEIMDYAKQKQVRLNFTLNVNKYNEYWDYFTQFKIWSNNAMKKSYIEFMCRYSIEWSGKSVSEILNNKTEWFSYLTKELVYLLKNYYDIIEPWIYRRWGDEKMEPKINIDYIKKEG